MANYQAKSVNALSFNLTQEEAFIGKISYKSWFSFKALIEIANQASYQIESKGFWGTTLELTEAGQRLLKFNLGWKGNVVIQTFFDNTEKEYSFEHRGVFKESFVLTDEEGTELLEMKPHLKWSIMNYEYEIITSDRFESFAHKKMLLLSSVHFANYYMSMVASAMTI